MTSTSRRAPRLVRPNMGCAAHLAETRQKSAHYGPVLLAVTTMTASNYAARTGTGPWYTGGHPLTPLPGRPSDPQLPRDIDLGNERFHGWSNHGETERVATWHNRRDEHEGR